MSSSVSFKEESSRVADREDQEKKALDELKQLIQTALNNHEFSSLTTSESSDPEKKALDELKQLIQTALNNHEFSSLTTSAPTPKVEGTQTPTPVVDTKEKSETEPPATAKEPEEVEKKTETQTSVVATKEKSEDGPVLPATQPQPEKVSIYGVTLLSDERSDVILLKFLRARDFKVKEAFTMIKNTVLWRKMFGIDALLDEDLGNDIEKVLFMHGFDREGHPVCYNVYGEFQNKELYEKTAFSDEEKRQKFIQGMILFLEKSIRNLDFSPGGISTMVQITDLKNSPGIGKWELRQATNQALHVLQDNYPEFLAKQVFINVPCWYLAFHKMISPFFFLTQRTKSKFVFAGPSKSAETLFKYITPEQVPVQYGGLSKEGEMEFSSTEPVKEITIKPGAKHTIVVPVSEACVLIWEVRVTGWEVNYGADFVPTAEDGYTVIVHKTRKISSSTDEPVICNSFKIGEPGKIVITIRNLTIKKKIILFRIKTKPYCSD